MGTIVTYLTYLLERFVFNVDKADFVQYPFFMKPEDLDIHLDEIQQSAVTRLIQKLEDGRYKKNKNNCLCGNNDNCMDKLVSCIDMHGIPLDVLLCRKCGLLRAAEIFDVASNENYYRFEYRDIHNSGGRSASSYFNDQLERGESFLKIARENRIIDEVATVLEIGCGSGGILYPFHLAGKKVAGFDYDENYVGYGRGKGMALHCMGKDPSVKAEPYDLLILSHVMEHFLDPRSELLQLIEQVKPGKYVIIEVPGVFAEVPAKVLYGYPVRYFQVAHVVQFFYRDFLNLFYASLGLEILYGDENATFLLRKPHDWTPPAVVADYSSKLSGYRSLVDRHLRECYSDYRYRPDLYKLKNMGIWVLELIGLKRVVKGFLKKRGLL